MQKFTSNSSHIYNNENISPEENNSSRIYKVQQISTISRRVLKFQ